MAAKIEKKDWVSRFTIIGTPIVTDYTFKLDQHSEKSSWVYNSMNLGIKCAEEYGTIYAEMMGGYGEDRDNVIYVHGKDDDGNDDFDNRFTIDWEDRLNEEILENVGDLCFITVGLEKDNKGKTYYKRFLSAYDAIQYMSQYISDDVVVNVKGNLKYSTYNDNTQVRKEITSIALSNVDDPAKHKATFTQSILIDKDSASLKNIDKDKGVMYVDAIVLDYLKEYNGVEVKGQFPYRKQFEFPMPLSDQTKCKKIMEKLFKVKKGVNQITFDGIFVEGGATVQTSVDDLPEDIKELIDFGVYTEEEALAKCSANGNRERRMILKQPAIQLVGDDDNKTPVIRVTEHAYEEEDLVLDCMNVSETASDDGDADSDDSDMDWLNDL